MIVLLLQRRLGVTIIKKYTPEKKTTASNVGVPTAMSLNTDVILLANKKAAIGGVSSATNTPAERRRTSMRRSAISLLH